jgi:hypothetical protein
MTAVQQFGEEVERLGTNVVRNRTVSKALALSAMDLYDVDTANRVLGAVANND